MNPGPIQHGTPSNRGVRWLPMVPPPHCHDFHRMQLLRSGDVEQNPGPAESFGLQEPARYKALRETLHIVLCLLVLGVVVVEWASQGYAAMAWVPSIPTTGSLCDRLGSD